LQARHFHRWKRIRVGRHIRDSTPRAQDNTGQYRVGENSSCDRVFCVEMDRNFEEVVVRDGIVCLKMVRTSCVPGTLLIRLHGLPNGAEAQMVASVQVHPSIFPNSSSPGAKLIFRGGVLSPKFASSKGHLKFLKQINFSSASLFIKARATISLPASPNCSFGITDLRYWHSPRCAERCGEAEPVFRTVFIPRDMHLKIRSEILTYATQSNASLFPNVFHETRTIGGIPLHMTFLHSK